MKIQFKKVPLFGRVDYKPLDAQAEAICNIKGRNLNWLEVSSLIAAGFEIGISE
jgi:hypothetical protein